MRSLVLIVALLLTAIAPASEVLHAQSPKKAGKPKATAAPTKTPVKPAQAPSGPPLNIIGIRPGVSMDSIRAIIARSGVTMREVKQDTLTHCFADQSIHIYVVDSIIVRLTYMRMSFLVDGSTNRLRRFTITPRESSIASGQDDDLEPVLLLYFGQGWGKPTLELNPPMPNFRWREGNIEVKGFIRRGYPVWVMEG